MNDPTSVTVIIPAYNAEAFIGRAIASVAAQTLPPHEFLSLMIARLTAHVA